MIGILSKLYSTIVNRKNKNFDDNKISLTRCNIPVISIGNLTVGGTGKTPFVEKTARLLIKNGIRPGVIGRGYKRKTKGEIVVCDGKKLLVMPEEAGDEMYLLAKKLKVPVIAHNIPPD